MTDDEIIFEDPKNKSRWHKELKEQVIYRPLAGETRPIRFLKFRNPETDQVFHIPIDANGKVIENAQKEITYIDEEFGGSLCAIIDGKKQNIADHLNAQKATAKLAKQEKQGELAWYNEVGTERERKAKD